MLLKDNEDLIDLGQFDPINQLIPFSVISLSVAHCINFLKGFVLTESDFLTVTSIPFSTSAFGWPFTSRAGL